MKITRTYRNTRIGVLCLPIALYLVTCLATVGSAASTGLLPNATFDHEIAGWKFRPGDNSQVSCVDVGSDRGNVIALTPDGRLLGFETERLEIGRELQPGQAYCIEALLKNEGLQKGVFAFSMYCFDADGKSLKQIVFCGLNTHSKPHDWKKQRGHFDPVHETRYPKGRRASASASHFTRRAATVKARFWSMT